MLQLAGIVLGALLSFVAASYWFSRAARVHAAEQLAEHHAQLEQRVTAAERQLALVGQAVLPISTAFQAILIKELTHFHTPELDALLQRIGPPCTMTAVEAARFEVLLEARTRDMSVEISASERDAATILPAVMRRATEEYAHVGELMVFQLITVTTPTEPR